MTSRWKAALISSALVALLGAAPARGAAVRSVSYAGVRAFAAAELERGSLLRAGAAFSDSLLARETLRVDSLYFAIGYVAVAITADTSSDRGGLAVRFEVAEGEPARVRALSVSGTELIGAEEAKGRVRPGPGQRFDAYLLEESLRGLLALYNDSGFPFAQVWLTGFTYAPEANAVDLAVSVSEGERSTIGRVVFEGITKTDSSTALRISRLKSGSAYRESRVETARRYLAASGLFESVGDPALERRGGGRVDVRVPVKDVSRANSFQGAIGFSRRENRKYVLNGSVALDLVNIAGTGRRVHFDWLNNGESYSSLALRFREPFLLGSRFSLAGEISQIIQDTVYQWNSGGLDLGYPVGPASSIIVGASADRNVPSGGALERSVRERFRLGFEYDPPGERLLSARIEGAYRKSYFAGNRAERNGELIYRVEGAFDAPTWASQSVFVRAVSEAVFSSGEIPLAELFPLGGATTLRGYREQQFRAERASYANVEYRFGEGGWLFLFDDAAAFSRRGQGWLAKNGVGFGMRSQSPAGVIVLSFGIGEEFSLQGTRVHISLVQTF